MPAGSFASLDFRDRGVDYQASGVVAAWEGREVTLRLAKAPRPRPPRPRRLTVPPDEVVASFVAEGAGLGRSFLPVLDLDERGLRVQSSLPLQPGTLLRQLEVRQHKKLIREAQGVVVACKPVVWPDDRTTWELSLRLRAAARGEATDDDPADLHRITHPERVRSVLWGLADLAYPVKVRVGELELGGRLELVKGPRAQLPQLSCRLDAPAILSGAVRLECTLYGSGYRFFGRVKRSEGRALVVDPAPVLLEWHRRDEERLVPPPELEAKVRFTHPLTLERAERKLLDLSVNGLSFERHPEETLWPGLPLEKVKIELGALSHQVSSAAVRSTSSSRCGLQLGAMTEEEADRLRTSLTRLSVRPVELDDGSRLEPLLELYQQVGLFLPPMLRNLEENLARIRREWPKAHQHPDGLMRTALFPWKSGVGGASTLIRAYEATWELEHAAVASASVPTDPGTLFGTLISLAVPRDDGQYVIGYISGDAKSQHKVMAEFIHDWSTPEFRGATPFSLWFAEEREPDQRPARARRLRRNEEVLVENVASRVLDPVCARALGLVEGQVTLPRTRAAFKRAGLERGREAWASFEHGACTHVLLRNWASPGLCVSSLLNAGVLLPVAHDPAGLKDLVEVLTTAAHPAPAPSRLLLVPGAPDSAVLEAAGLKRVADCVLYAIHRNGLQEYRRFVSSRYGFLHGRFRSRPTEAA